jgi:hypothetical protein
MTKAIPAARRIQLLLNTLLGERYIRRSLLLELVDELTDGDGHADAMLAGRALLERLESGLDEGEYEARISRIYELTAPTNQAPLYAEAAE